jgi:hypothetical protein
MGIQTSIRPISITEFRPPMELLNPNDKSNASNSTEFMIKKELQPDRKQQSRREKSTNTKRCLIILMNSSEECKKKSVLARRRILYSNTKKEKNYRYS